MNTIDIMIVEDEASSREILQALLNEENLTTLTAESGEVALNLLGQGQNPSLLVCDLNMPGMGGLRFIQKALEALPDLTVIVLTGELDIKNVQQAVRLGAADFLLKPYLSQDLISRIYRSLEISKIKKLRAGHGNPAEHLSRRETFMRLENSKKCAA